MLLYLLTQYQTAAAKEIGCLDYRYTLRGDRETLGEIVRGQIIGKRSVRC